MPNTLVSWFRKSNPDESVALTDDQITLRYAQQAEKFKATGVDLFERYPDFKEDVERLKASAVQDSITVMDRAKQVARSVAGSFVETVASPFSVGASFAKRFTSGDVDLGGAVDTATGYVSEAVSPDVDPEKAQAMSGDFLTTKVPSAIGSAAGFMTGGGVVGAAGKAAGMSQAGAKLAGISGLGAAAGFDEQFQTAMKAGATEDDAFQAGLLGAGVGASEIVPLSRMLDRLTPFMPNNVSRDAFVRQLLTNATKETFEEAVQEGFQSGAGDVIARNIVAYDPTREVFGSLSEDAAVGGVSGLIFSLLTQGIQRAASRAAAPETPATSEAVVSPIAQPKDPAHETIDEIRRDAYEIDLRGIEDVLARSLAGDNVEAEVSVFSPDARRLYEVKRNAALVARVTKEKAEAEKIINEAVADALGDEAASVGTTEEEKPNVTQQKFEIQNKLAKRDFSGSEIDNVSTATTVDAESLPGVIIDVESEPVQDVVDVEIVPRALIGGPEETGKPKDDSTSEAAAPKETKLIEAPKEPAATSEPAVEPEHIAIAKTVEEFGKTNTGLDSLEYITAQVEEQKKAVDSLHGVRVIADLAVKRLSQAGADGALPATNLLPEEEAGLSKLLSDSTEAAGLSDILSKSKAGILTISDLRQLSKESIQLGDAAYRRYVKSSEIAGSLGAADGKKVETVPPEALVNSSAINYGARSAFPGYYSVMGGRGSADHPGSKLAAISASYIAAKDDLVREKAAIELGTMLADGAQVTNKSKTRRLTAWRNTETGATLLLSTFVATGKGVKGANSSWRFHIGGKNKFAGKTRKGIRDLLDAGYAPIASMQMVSPRGQIAMHFKSTKEFMDFVGTEAEAMAKSHIEAVSRRELAVSEAKNAAATGVTQAHTGPEAVFESSGNLADAMSGDEAASETEASVSAEAESIAGEVIDLLIENKTLVKDIAAWIESHPNGKPDEVIKEFGPRFLTLIPNDAPDGFLSEAERALEIIIETMLNERVRNGLIKTTTTGGGSGTSESDARETGGVRKDGESVRSGGDSAAEAPVSQVATEESPTEVGGTQPEAAATEGTPDLVEASVAASGLTDVQSTAIRAINELEAGGKLPPKWAKEAREEVGEAETEEEVRNTISNVLELAGMPASDNESSPDEPSDEELDDFDRARALLPDSEDAVFHNIARFKSGVRRPSSAGGVLGENSLAAMQSDYGSVADALSRIASTDARPEYTRLAEAMTRNANLTGVTLRLINDPDWKSLGRYRSRTGEITINLALHRDLSDVHESILHEIVHGFTSRLGFRGRNYPGSLRPEESEAIRAIDRAMAVAKDRGLTWQDSDAADPGVVWDEFVAAVMTDTKFQARLALEKDSDQSIFAWLKAALSKLIAFVMRSQSGSEGALLAQAQAAVDTLIKGYSESTSLADAMLASVAASKGNRPSARSGWLSSSGIVLPTDSVPPSEAKIAHVKMATGWLAENDPGALEAMTASVDTLATPAERDLALAGAITEYMHGKGWVRVDIGAGSVRFTGRPNNVQRSLLRREAEASKKRLEQEFGASGARVLFDPSNDKDIIRYRNVDGMLGSGQDITVDASGLAAAAETEALRMMATTNEVDDTLAGMRQAWERAGGNIDPKTGTLRPHAAFVADLVNDLFRGTLYTADQIRTAINAALTSQGGTPVNVNARAHDLETRGERPKAVRDELVLLQRLQGKLSEMHKTVQDEFGKRNILQKIADSNTELFEITNKYEDSTLIGREFVKEIRRAINESGDVGALGFAKALNPTATKADVNAAAATIQASIPSYVDALQALADTGFDFGDLRGKKGVPAALTPAMVHAAVLRSSDPAIAPLQNTAALALALQFARRRPIVMDLLSTRRKPGQERSALKAIITLAVSNRPDAFDLASAKLSSLKHLGASGQRIVNKLREIKRENRELIERANRYSEFDTFYSAAIPTLNGKIRSIERELSAEAGMSGRQWAAVNGASYFVPVNAAQAEESLFVDAVSNTSRKELRFGEGFDPVAVRKDIISMKEWLAGNPQLAGSANYELLKRQSEKLTLVMADAANWQIQRGPGGIIIRLFGDVATQADHLGTQSSREFARQMRLFSSNYEAHLRVADQKEFYAFDRLEREAMIATGIEHPEEFKDRIYNRGFAFLESRQDLLNPNLTPEQQLETSINEAIRYISSDPAMARNGAAVAVNRLMRQAVKCSEIVQETRRKMGLKVKETMKDGRVIFREVIGHPAHTMSRMITKGTRSIVADKMATPWSWDSTFRDMSGAQVNALSKTVVSGLHAGNRVALADALAQRFTPEVLDRFARPLVTKPGNSNFFGPTIAGIKDRAKRSNVIDAFNLSKGDMIAFAEILHALEGGTPDTLSDFVGETMATFQRYYALLGEIASIKGDNHDNGDRSTEIARAFLDSRQGEDFPPEWLDYRSYGHVDHIRYNRILASHAAFGASTSDATANLRRAEAELMELKSQYEEAMRQPTPAGRDALLDAGGLRKARENAAKNVESLKRITANFQALYGTLRGAPQDEKTLIQIVGSVAGLSVQGVTTAMTDTVSMVETPFRKFGFSKQALSFIFGTWKNFGFEALGSLFQAIGVTWSANAHHRNLVRSVNSAGLTDIDALTTRRGVRSLAERYAEELGAEITMRAVAKRHKGQPLKMAGAVAAGAARRAAIAMRVAMNSGIGVAKDKSNAFASLKVLQPFTQNNIWMHRAVAMQWLKTVNAATSAAEAYFRAHPADAAAPSFTFTAKTLGYSTRSLLGFRIDDRSFEYLTTTLAGVGITLEEAGRRAIRGEPALTNEQVHSVTALAQSEILFNSSAVTRPAWTMTSTAGRVSAPLVGWALYKMADLVKTTRNAKGQAEARAFASALTAFALGVVPVTLAYAILRDEYEEEVLGKKANVLPLTMDENLPMALLDNLSRVGAFGIGGDVANSIFNVSTAREFSIDSRVFAVSSLMNLGKLIGQLYRQEGTATYQTIYRPFLQSIGGSGYLQNIDAINNLAGFDNQERRVVRRINVANQLRAAGREMGLDVRTQRGGAALAMPDPVKPWVYQMATAAYANDPAGFRSAYAMAKMAAIKRAMRNKTPDADPVADVAESYQRIHPLRSVFSKAPTTGEYQKLLRVIGDGAGEVSAAIRNFNSYGSQIPQGRGKAGIKPFTGTDRREPAVKLGGGLGASESGGYRSIVAGF